MQTSPGWLPQGNEITSGDALPKTPPSYCWGCVCQSSLLLFYPFSLWNGRVKDTWGGRRGLEKVVDESKQYAINERLPRGESQPFNLNRSKNDTTVYQNLLLLLPGRADSKECMWFPSSCSTPVSQQEKICGLNPQLVKISAAPMKLLEQLCISPAEKLVLSARPSGGVGLGYRSAAHYVLGPGQTQIRLSSALRVWKKRFKPGICQKCICSHRLYQIEKPTFEWHRLDVLWPSI